MNMLDNQLLSNFHPKYTGVDKMKEEIEDEVSQKDSPSNNPQQFVYLLVVYVVLNMVISSVEGSLGWNIEGSAVGNGSALHNTMVGSSRFSYSIFPGQYIVIYGNIAKEKFSTNVGSDGIWSRPLVGGYAEELVLEVTGGREHLCCEVEGEGVVGKNISKVVGGIGVSSTPSRAGEGVGTGKTSLEAKGSWISI